MKSNRVKDIRYYMDLPYTLVVKRDEDGDFVAKVAELPGCSAHGSNAAEALDHLKEAQQLWLEDAIEAGQPPPEPEPPANLPSGKWVQRVPRSLHQRLSQLAKRENVSLNQLVTSLLSGAVVSVLVDTRTARNEGQRPGDRGWKREDLFTRGRSR